MFSLKELCSNGHIGSFFKSLLFVYSNTIKAEAYHECLSLELCGGQLVTWYYQEC